MSKALLKLVQDEIAAAGPLSVERYMQLALQHPEHGYYVKGDPLGQKGDFVTAPEISQMFGEMAGLWCAEVWRLLGKPDPFVWLELGPGRGTLLRDALRATRKVEGFHQAARLCLIESNETFRSLQRDGLAGEKISFIENIEALPSEPVIAIANEFFDALPVRQYAKTKEGWREILVSSFENELRFIAGDQIAPLPFPDGVSFFEISPQAVAWMRALARHLVARRGAALVVDYGYVGAAGASTLQAVSGHKAVDVLKRPGEVDLTAHVDFSALAAAARKEGARVSSVVGQGDFLRALGIEIRADALKRKATAAQALEIDNALRRLTDPDEMGGLFKAMALFGSAIDDAPGFP